MSPWKVAARFQQLRLALVVEAGAEAAAALVQPRRRLDLDHLGSQVAKQPADVRHGEDRGQVEHQHPRQRPGRVGAADIVGWFGSQRGRPRERRERIRHRGPGRAATLSGVPQPGETGRGAGSGVPPAVRPGSTRHDRASSWVLQQTGRAWSTRPAAPRPPRTRRGGACARCSVSSSATSPPCSPRAASVANLAAANRSSWNSCANLASSRRDR